MIDMQNLEVTAYGDLQLCSAAPSLSPEETDAIATSEHDQRYDRVLDALPETQEWRAILREQLAADKEAARCERELNHLHDLRQQAIKRPAPGLTARLSELDAQIDVADAALKRAALAAAGIAESEENAWRNIPAGPAVQQAAEAHQSDVKAAGDAALALLREAIAPVLDRPEIIEAMAAASRSKAVGDYLAKRYQAYREGQEVGRAFGRLAQKAGRPAGKPAAPVLRAAG